MINDLVNAGYNARRKRDSQQELQCFKLWREQEKMPDSRDMGAEISWEKNLSQLKIKNISSSARDRGWNDF